MPLQFHTPLSRMRRVPNSSATAVQCRLHAKASLSSDPLLQRAAFFCIIMNCELPRCISGTRLLCRFRSCRVPTACPAGHIAEATRDSRMY